MDSISTTTNPKVGLVFAVIMHFNIPKDVE